jgi:hypothetical protein
MTKYEKWVSAMASEIYRARHSGAVNPEGKSDSAKRWYPSNRESGNGHGEGVRSPSREWPYSYMSRCRSKVHCRVLVDLALQGEDVPPDVRDVVKRALTMIQIGNEAEEARLLEKAKEGLKRPWRKHSTAMGDEAYAKWIAMKRKSLKS